MKKRVIVLLLVALATIVQASVRVHITLGGFGKHPSSQPVWLKVYEPGTTTAVWNGGPVFPDSNGFASFQPPVSGVFDIGVKCSHWLEEVLAGVNHSPSSVATVSTFLDDTTNGDCDFDGYYIGTDDYLVLTTAFDTVPGDAAFDARADLNGDDYIGSDDYLILNSNFDMQAPASRTLATTGRHFWFAFPKTKTRITPETQYPDPDNTLYDDLEPKQLRLYLHADQPGSVRVQQAGTGNVLQVFPDANSQAAYENFLPNQLWSGKLPLDGTEVRELDKNDATSFRTFLASSSVPIALQAVTNEEHNTEGYTVLPLQALGFDYVVTSYKGVSGLKSFITVIAPFGGNGSPQTSVTITPSVPAGPTRRALEPFTINLNSGQAYQLYAASADGDLTGTTITSTSPIAVLTGSQRSSVFSSSNSEGAENNLLEQSLPTDLWGDEFIAQGYWLDSATNGLVHRSSIFRVVAARNNTNIWKNGSIITQENSSIPLTLRRGEYYDVYYSESEGNTVHLRSGALGNSLAKKPVSVTQISYSYNNLAASNPEANPFITTVPSLSQYSSALRFSMPSNLPEEHATLLWRYFANVVVPTSDIPNLKHNGVALTPSDFTQVPNTLYSIGKLRLSIPGTPTINGGLHAVSLSNGLGASNLGAIAYGHGFCDALGTLASMSLVNNGGANQAPTSPSMVSYYAEQPVYDSNDFSVKLAWQDLSSNEHGFYIERRRDSETAFVLIGSVGPNVQTFEDTSTLQRDATYLYRVCAYNDLSSPWTTPVGVFTPPKPPTSLENHGSTTTSVALEWDDQSQKESPGFIVERSGPNNYDNWDAWKQVPALPEIGTVQFTYPDLIPNTTYHFRVRSLRSSLFGLMEDQPYIVAKTKDLPPIRPDALIATAWSDTEMRLTWTDGLRATETEIQRSLVDSSQDQHWTFVTRVPQDSSPYFDSGLDGGTMYYYRARSWNNTGTTHSDWSYAVGKETEMPPPPAAPTGLVAEATDEDVLLTWNDTSNNELHFAVERKTGTGAWQVLTTTLSRNTTSYMDATVSGNTAYSYRVFAWNRGGDSPHSNVVSIMTPNEVPATIPNYLRALSFAKALKMPGQLIEGTVEMARRVTSDTTVFLFSNDVSVPTSVTTQAGSRRARFSVVAPSMEDFILRECRVTAKNQQWGQTGRFYVTANSSAVPIEGFTAMRSGQNSWISWPRTYTEMLGYTGLKLRLKRSMGFSWQDVFTAQRVPSSDFLDSTLAQSESYQYLLALVSDDGAELGNSTIDVPTTSATAEVGWLNTPTWQDGHLIAELASPELVESTGTLFWNGFSAGAVSRSGRATQSEERQLLLRIQQSALPSGSGSIVIAHKQDDKLFVSSPRSVTNASTLSISREPDLITSDVEQFAELAGIQLGEGDWSLIVKDQNGVAVAQFNGFGSSIGLSWDGKTYLGSPAPEGKYSCTVTSAQGTAVTSNIIIKYGAPTCLAIIGFIGSDPNLYRHDFNVHIENMLEEIAESNPQFNYVVWRAEGVDDQLNLSAIRRWLSTSVTDFYYWGHGQDGVLDLGNGQTIRAIGNNIERLAYLNDQIAISPCREARFEQSLPPFNSVFLDSCQSCGGPNSFACSSGSVSDLFFRAFGFSYNPIEPGEDYSVAEGGMIAFNGWAGTLTTFGGNAWTAWANWTKNYWSWIARQATMLEAVTNATIDTSPFPFSLSYPWTDNKLVYRGASDVYIPD